MDYPAISRAGAKCQELHNCRKPISRSGTNRRRSVCDLALSGIISRLYFIAVSRDEERRRSVNGQQHADRSVPAKKCLICIVCCGYWGKSPSPKAIGKAMTEEREIRVMRQRRKIETPIISFPITPRRRKIVLSPPFLSISRPLSVALLDCQEREGGGNDWGKTLSFHVSL